jgi:hypothetical protein
MMRIVIEVGQSTNAFSLRENRSAKDDKDSV